MPEPSVPSAAVISPSLPPALETHRSVCARRLLVSSCWAAWASCTCRSLPNGEADALRLHIRAASRSLALFASSPSVAALVELAHAVRVVHAQIAARI